MSSQSGDALNLKLHLCARLNSRVGRGSLNSVKISSLLYAAVLILLLQDLRILALLEEISLTFVILPSFLKQISVANKAWIQSVNRGSKKIIILIDLNLLLNGFNLILYIWRD